MSRKWAATPTPAAGCCRRSDRQCCGRACACACGGEGEGEGARDEGDAPGRRRRRRRPPLPQPQSSALRAGCESLSSVAAAAAAAAASTASTSTTETTVPKDGFAQTSSSSAKWRWARRWRRWWWESQREAGACWTEASGAAGDSRRTTRRG